MAVREYLRPSPYNLDIRSDKAYIWLFEYGLANSKMPIDFMNNLCMVDIEGEYILSSSNKPVSTCPAAIREKLKAYQDNDSKWNLLRNEEDVDDVEKRFNKYYD